MRAARNGRQTISLPDVQAALATLDHNFGYSPALGMPSAKKTRSTTRHNATGLGALQLVQSLMRKAPERTLGLSSSTKGQPTAVLTIAHGHPQGVQKSNELVAVNQTSRRRTCRPVCCWKQHALWLARNARPNALVRLLHLGNQCGR